MHILWITLGGIFGVVGVVLFFAGPVLGAWNLLHPWLQDHGYMQL